MSKAHLWQIIFVIVAVIAFIPLTAEVFGDKNPDVISISAGVLWVGLIGSGICAIVRFIHESQKK